MGYWKNLKNAKARHDAALGKWIDSRLAAFGERLKISKRVEALNDWCDRHPKRMFAITIIFCLCGITITVNSLVSSDRNGTPIAPMNDIIDISGVLEAVRSNNEGKEQIRNGILEIMKIGSDALHEIDSLMALPTLTHDDSVRLWVATKQLKIINTTFDETQD